MRRQLLKSTTAADTGTIALLALLFLAAAFRLFIAINLPIWFRPELAHDDGLFMRLATNLAGGHWLGHYDQFTLMKGPGYPAFLAIASLSGLPVSAAHGIFQIAAVAIVAGAIYRLSASRLIATLTFLVLLFDPVGFMPTMQRIIRDQIYWAQTLTVFSLFAIIFFVPPRDRAAAIAVSIIAGIVLGWTWLSREEGVWLLPGLALLAAGAALLWRNDKQALRAVASNGALAAAGYLGVIASFMTANLIAYGSFIGVDFKEHNFQAALDALQDVDVGPIMPHVPVPAAAREAAAKVSPTFAPLAKLLAPGGPMAGWSVYGCKFYKNACGDIAGGWFVWAFRNAAAANGFYKSPSIAAREFGKIADEIALACSDGRLRCRNRWVSEIPPMTSAQWASVPATSEKIAALIAFIGVPNADVTPLSSKGKTPEAFERYWNFLNRPFISVPSKKGPKTTVRGWYRDSRSTRWPGFAVYTKKGQRVPFTLKRQKSPDLQKYFADARLGWNRFEISYSCPDQCTLAALTFNRPDLRLPIDRDKNMSATAGTATILVDVAYYDWQSPAALTWPQTIAVRARSELAHVYQILVPALLLIGLIALIAACDGAIAARTLNPVLLVAFAAWALVATRIGLLALIDVSSFPAAVFEYTPSGAYMAVVAASVSMAAVVVLQAQTFNQLSGGIR